ncbi:MAG: malonic semialdehyde reductase [Ponticaulis sp.]|nr:malonic semialdehyde reductase [Ponticaulis sp.]|tara:strand:+ start:94976 stop:95578 length:603 start_codon:yes stop_codon:yes gene_type:complete
MSDPLPGESLDQIFRSARTYNQWQDKDVPESLIRATYDLLKMGPTSANCCPARFVFVRTEEAKQRLAPLMSEGNREKTIKAPWTVIIANDLEFHEKIPELFPHNPGAKDWFKDPQNRAETAFRNGTLQGAYLMIAARAMGLDCGPLSGFDREGVDKEFFQSNPETESWTANFICNLAYGDPETLFPRSPRLDFESACQIL